MRTRTEPSFDSLLDSWVRDLRAANLSPRTIQSYTEAAGQFLDHLNRVAPEAPVTAIEGAHVESYISDVLRRHSAPTAGNRNRSLQQLFRWLQDEGEIDASPMQHMRPPKVPEQPVRPGLVAASARALQLSSKILMGAALGVNTDSLGLCHSRSEPYGFMLR